ncbi:uncharacterized protein LOC124940479 [Impatiens glandulifera]|uniref:uncharacterized protein LOC124940479 n=1 Tax=Impatiens glandulifera TaxID=253017 RepID=UPI001FB0E34D|nr:uncharacterized protein LOC124940479 [Impatiens glandulifera]
MASATCIPRFSYQRLRYEEEDDGDELGAKKREIGVEKKEKKKNRRKMRLRRWKRKIIVRIRIGRLKRWLMRRKASKVVAASLAKVATRLKESQSHFGDLFAGNYLFLQINPPPPPVVYHHAF